MNENQITIEGNLGTDPELKFSGDLPIVNFSIAHTPRKKNKNTNEYEDGEPIWFKVTAFKYLAESVADSAVKGDRVVVIGTLAQSHYNDKNTGEAKTSLEIVANFIGKPVRMAKKKQEEEAAPW